jgi:hypothetical protein
VQQLLDPAHVAAFLLDPLYAVLPSNEPGAMPDAPQVPGEHEKKMAYDLVNRVGGR